jgi:ribosome-binding protein aMBF1 (putative translation factor)
MNHQDWTTTVIGNKNKQNAKLPKNIVKKVGDTSINDELRKIEDSTENFAHKKIHSALAKEIITYRNSLKLTQKDMAVKLNTAQNIYTELESGKAIYSNQTKQLINKIERILNIKFQNK